MQPITRICAPIVPTALALILAVILAPSAWADSAIDLQPGAYTGRYSVPGNANLSGPQTVILPEGTHTLTIAPSVSFQFHVDAAGVVSSLNAAAATGGANLLQLNTTSITVDPNGFSGLYSVANVDNVRASGLRTFVVLPGIAGYIFVLAPGNGFRFDVDAAGNVLSQVAAAAVGSGDTLALQPSTLTVDPADYIGVYRIRGVDDTEAAGVRTFAVLPGLPGYILTIAPSNDFRFDVDAAGNASSQTPSAAEGIGATLRFNTSTVRVQPTDYEGTYAVRSVDETPLAGERCFVLMPGVVGYILDIGPGVNGRFDVDPLGAPTPATLLIDDGSNTRTFALSPDCGNDPPTADAGPNQSIHAGETVQLDGRGSFDDQTDSADLLYAWSFVLRPIGSSAVLSDADTSLPNFVADVIGSYQVQLVVTDQEGLSSLGDNVVVSSENVAPTADAGADAAVHVDGVAQLDGSGSSDPDLDPITYQWIVLSAPTGSVAMLDDDTAQMPTLAPDLEGTYVVALIVSDPYAASQPDEVTIVAIGPGFAQQQLQAACDLIAGMPSGSFDAKGHRKSLCNEIARILRFIGKDRLDKAESHLLGLIERVDGCVLRGAPDAKGAGQAHAADHIVDCDDQVAIYELLLDALAAL